MLMPINWNSMGAWAEEGGAAGGCEMHLLPSSEFMDSFKRESVCVHFG